MSRKFRMTAATAVALILALGVAGCSSDDEGAGAPAPSSSATQPVGTEGEPQVPAAPPEPDAQSNTQRPSAPDDAGQTTQQPDPSNQTEGPAPDVVISEDEALMRAATGFITARENQSSQQHQSPLDWLEEARPYVTDNYYETMKAQINPDGSLGADWHTAHDEGIAVRVEVSECGVNVASGVDTDTQKVIQCAVTDIVVDKDGNALPTTQIPLNWTRAGSQPVAMLLMVKEGDKWLVDQDGTGMVS